ncbi:hypothetical protein DFH27DRAFT_604569 [Peziza echinospora]|nr:hypothetical protein DFH27DRAFT_604569 [Peziza echinospora]
MHAQSRDMPRDVSRGKSRTLVSFLKLTESGAVHENQLKALFILTRKTINRRDLGIAGLEDKGLGMAVEVLSLGRSGHEKPALARDLPAWGVRYKKMYSLKPGPAKKYFQLKYARVLEYFLLMLDGGTSGAKATCCNKYKPCTPLDDNSASSPTDTTTLDPTSAPWPALVTPRSNSPGRGKDMDSLNEDTWGVNPGLDTQLEAFIIDLNETMATPQPTHIITVTITNTTSRPSSPIGTPSGAQFPPITLVYPDRSSTHFMKHLFTSQLRSDTAAAWGGKILKPAFPNTITLSGPTLRFRFRLMSRNAEGLNGDSFQPCARMDVHDQGLWVGFIFMARMMCAAGGGGAGGCWGGNGTTTPRVEKKTEKKNDGAKGENVASGVVCAMWIGMRMRGMACRGRFASGSR